MAQLQPSFKFAMGYPIIPRMVAYGKFDGKHPALACGTSGNRVFVYSPHTHTENAKLEVRFLNTNRELKALNAAPLDPNSPNSVLLIGSVTSVLAFDVENNKDIYMREVSDGVSTVTVGKVSGLDAPLCLVGGNCSIQGFDHEGEEMFWTVAGDFVGAIEVADITKSGHNAIIIGTDDNEIRICDHESNIILESTQTDKVVALQFITGSRFAYALANGTVGMYEYEKGAVTRKWRVKSKHKVCAICAFDVNGDGVLEVLIGWSNGRLEVRHETTGEVLCKDTLDSAIAAIVTGDIRMDNRHQVIVLTVEGEVRGYVQNSGVVKTEETRLEEEESLLTQLNQTKQELLTELKNYEDNVRHMKTGQMKQGEGQLIMIPVDTDIKCSWRVDEEKQCVNLSIATNNSSVVRGVVIFADQLFQGESLFICPKEQSSELIVPLKPAKDVASDLFLKVFIGQRNGSLFHLKEQNYKMPRFSMYVPLPIGQRIQEPKSAVTFTMGQAEAAQVVDWLNSSFNIQFEHTNRGNLSVSFVSLRDQGRLIISLTGAEMKIQTESMELAGDLVQDLADFTGTTELTSTANFPEAMESFKDTLKSVDQHNESRLALAAESAELTGRVKEMIVRAEDSRLLGDFANMKKLYTRIMDVNRELMGEHQKRSANQKALLDSLKAVNQMIQKAARLRVGTPKSQVVAACREAIKNNNVQQVFHIIQTANAT